MKIEAESPEDYVDQLPENRRIAIQKLREVISNNLPEGFTETISYGMIGYVIPLSLYPDGYHVSNSQPLPFMNLASQKNFIALYHMGLYANNQLLEWFTQEYPKHSSTRLDMGKSCIRFKNPDKIPSELIGELAGKMTAKQWINLYEQKFKK